MITARNHKPLLLLIMLLVLSACASQPQRTNTTMVPTTTVPDMCAPENGAPFSYRKKVAILAADIRDPQQDLPALDVAWSEALQRHVGASQRLLVSDASTHHLYEGPQQREWVMTLARQLDVQFIIAVRLRNLHLQRTHLGSGNYSIPLPRATRQLDIELLIFDGYYGNLLTRFAHTAHIAGMRQNIINPPHQPVLRGSFMTTTLGRAMTQILTAQTNDMLAALACLPLMERVFKVSGHRVYLSSHAASLIRPGDSLQLFYQQGPVETHLGPVKISTISPESAIAIYQGESPPPPFAPGLRVRAW